MDRIRLIASDMDATLLDEYSQLPPKFTETIRALAGQGILFAAASGRPLYTLETMFPDLLEEIILIGDNGGAARWKGKDLFVSEMPAEGWRQLARSTKQAGDVGLLCGLQAAYAEKRDEKYDKVFKNFYTRVEYVDDLTAVEAAADKFTVYLPNDDSQKAFDRIYGAFRTGNGGAFSVAVAGRNWVDVMNPGVHKGAALAKVGALLSIPADSMMAFGDTYNDAEMLTTAKYGFLMENGSGPLRAQVPFLAPSHREYGVMQVLKQVLRQNGEVSPEDFVKAHGDVTI